MTLQLKQFLFIATTVCGLASCSCEEKKTGNDAGTSTPDADVDSGTQPVDPQIDWLTISAGSFTFGSPESTPCRGANSEKEVPVTLTRPFAMSKYEVIQKQWRALGFPLPHRAPDCSDCPITFINTHEAMAWCNALSRFEGLEECYDLSSCTGDIGGGCPDGDFYELGCLSDHDSGAPTIDGLYLCSNPVRRYASMYDCSGYRLPTGPEWEYAAKAGTTTNTYNGDITEGQIGDLCADEPILNEIAWYCFNTGAGSYDSDWNVAEQLHAVGLKQPNPWGVYDMLGNAGEWVDYASTGLSLDTNEGKPDQPLVDPMGAAEDSGSRGDARGGWMFRQACTTRAAYQFPDSRDNRSSAYGFRPVRTLPATSTDAGVK